MGAKIQKKKREAIKSLDRYEELIGQPEEVFTQQYERLKKQKYRYAKCYKEEDIANLSKDEQQRWRFRNAYKTTKSEVADYRKIVRIRRYNRNIANIEQSIQKCYDTIYGNLDVEAGKRRGQ